MFLEVSEKVNLYEQPKDIVMSEAMLESLYNYKYVLLSILRVLQSHLPTCNILSLWLW